MNGAYSRCKAGECAGRGGSHRGFPLGHRRNDYVVNTLHDGGGIALDSKPVLRTVVHAAGTQLCEAEEIRVHQRLRP
jgi:hypothetical protein